MTSQTLQELPDPLTLPTAGFLPRLAAYLVDQFVLAPLVVGIYYFMVQAPSLLGLGLLWFLHFLYKPAMEALYGFTLGKLLLRMRVVDRATNLVPDFNQSMVRYLPFAVANFIYLFVLLRVFRSPEFVEVETLKGYLNFLTLFPLKDNFIVSLLNNFPFFSGVWLILDPWHRALHDRWAETFVVKKIPDELLNR